MGSAASAEELVRNKPPPATLAEGRAPAMPAAAGGTGPAELGTLHGAPGNDRQRMYVPVRVKFSLMLALSTAWALFALWAAQRWIDDLAAAVGPGLAYFVILGIAVIPGWMNAFLLVGLLLDRRPRRPRLAPAAYPPVSILVAAYNEEATIASTLQSIALQNYPAALQVIVINDGSTDGTREVLRGLSYPWLEVLDMPVNGGKAKGLNAALERVRYGLTVTLDADSYLYRDALAHIVERFIGDPENTAAVAGAVLVRNSRTNWVTRIQEWDYFNGIAAIKRVQSFLQGTLVAQGAYSLYRTDVLRDVGGWPLTVGEDIVVTWAILEKGWRVGYCEDACVFTQAPESLRQFIRQRQRWSRGLIEAFKRHGRLLFHARMTTIFIWWNLLFPYIDFVYSFVFLPGIVLALFGIFWIAGPMTLLVLPMALGINYVIYRIQLRMFKSQGLRVRRNVGGFLIYAFLYGAILQPACFVGYMAELLNLRKHWGTK